MIVEFTAVTRLGEKITSNCIDYMQTIQGVFSTAKFV